MVINGGSPIIQNTFGGVSVNDTPSQISPNEMEAAKIADLTGGSHYNYNPATRFQQNFMNSQTMGGPGIGVAYQQPMYFQQPQYPQMGLGGYPITGFQQQPMMQEPQYGWNYYSAQPQQGVAFGTLGYNSGNYPQYNSGGNYNRQRYANSAFGTQFVYQDQTYIEPGFSPYGSMIFTSEDNERLNNIMEREAEEQKEYRNKMGQMYNGMNYNYYGNFNYGYNSYISAKYQKEVYQIMEEAKERQVEFNKRLSRAAHTYLGDDIDDDYIDNIYDEREITVPATDIQNLQTIQRLSTFTVDYRELTKAQYYAINNQISEEYHNKILNDKNCDSLTSFLDNAGELYALGMQYDVDRQKRDVSGFYDRDAFKNTFQQNREKRFGTMFPNLSENSRMLSDGTLEIKAPAWISGSSRDSEESYKQNRQKFIDSIYNQSRGGRYL